MHQLIVFTQNWNFVFPLLLWGFKEAYVRLRIRGKRVRIWGVRHDPTVQVIVVQQRTGGNYKTGDLGPLAEARSSQKLVDHFRGLGLRPNLLDASQVDKERSANLVVVGVLTQPPCLAGTMLTRLGYPATVKGEQLMIGDKKLGIDLRLAESRLSVETEYGIFVRGRNPENPRHTLVVIGALTSNGLEATIDAILRNGAKPKAITRRGSAAVVVRTAVDTKDSDIKPLALPKPIS